MEFSSLRIDCSSYEYITDEAEWYVIIIYILVFMYFNTMNTNP
jgi:hypothetical protein